MGVCGHVAAVLQYTTKATRAAIIPDGDGWAAVGGPLREGAAAGPSAGPSEDDCLEVPGMFNGCEREGGCLMAAAAYEKAIRMALIEVDASGDQSTHVRGTSGFAMDNLAQCITQ